MDLNARVPVAIPLQALYQQGRPTYYTSFSSLPVELTIIPSVGPSASSLPSRNSILDDTSIAALALPNGDRRLFFQDVSGVIRQAFGSSSSEEWRADISYVVALNAKNHTPIAAALVPLEGSYSKNDSQNYPPNVSFFVRSDGIIRATRTEST